ncbi:hypothetical protein BKA70DRAFT_1220792 [Coprinopsis sp. MPI-PUGE-AT-0042]|nr:hypothetical protein BKA70DRAFT_1220792 [Coprinopsis sp. MPI-PUGE-AT-0042]
MYRVEDERPSSGSQLWLSTVDLGTLDVSASGRTKGEKDGLDAIIGNLQAYAVRASLASFSFSSTSPQMHLIYLNIPSASTCTTQPILGVTASGQATKPASRMTARGKGKKLGVSIPDTLRFLRATHWLLYSHPFLSCRVANTRKWLQVSWSTLSEWEVELLIRVSSLVTTPEIRATVNILMVAPGDVRLASALEETPVYNPIWVTIDTSNRVLPCPYFDSMPTTGELERRCRMDLVEGRRRLNEKGYSHRRQSNTGERGILTLPRKRDILKGPERSPEARKDNAKSRRTPSSPSKINSSSFARPSMRTNQNGMQGGESVNVGKWKRRRIGELALVEQDANSLMKLVVELKLALNDIKEGSQSDAVEL